MPKNIYIVNLKRLPFNPGDIVAVLGEDSTKRLSVATMLMLDCGAEAFVDDYQDLITNVSNMARPGVYSTATAFASTRKLISNSCVGSIITLTPDTTEDKVIEMIAEARFSYPNKPIIAVNLVGGDDDVLIGQILDHGPNTEDI